MPETPPATDADAGPASPESAGPSTQELDERLKLLERKDEVAQEQAAEKAKTAPTVTAGREGVQIRSADGSTFLRLRGYVQADGQFYTEDDERPTTNTFLLRRVRPIFEGQVSRYFEFRFMPDFGAGTTVIQDAWMDWKFGSSTRLRAGKTKVPFGLERLQSALDILFAVRNAVTNIAPNRDIGLMMTGEPLDGLVNWSAGIWNGVSDGGSSDTDTGSGKEGSARVFVQPFLRTSSTAFRGFGVGIAATYGQNEGTPVTPALAAYRTAGAQTFFNYRSDATATAPATATGTTVASGRRKRVSPQMYWSIGRFGLLAEYARSDQEVTRAPSTTNLTNEAWDAIASFLVTDDVASYKGVTPKRPFDPGSDGFGAVEIVARAGAQRQDENSFPFYANPATAAEVARDRGVGVNWYLSRNAKLMLDYIETRFAGGATGGDREDERVILNRFQVSF
ncbi:MAG TPA: porin [Candidatus Polarisedimenticolia bacterium]|nr:porin [Candidatus Polarisedimenticolia bacterium]